DSLALFGVPRAPRGCRSRAPVLPAHDSTNCGWFGRVDGDGAGPGWSIEGKLPEQRPLVAWRRSSRSRVSTDSTGSRKQILTWVPPGHKVAPVSYGAGLAEGGRRGDRP